MKLLISAIAGALITYLIASFIVDDFNTSNWSVYGRLSAVWMSCGVAVLFHTLID